MARVLLLYITANSGHYRASLAVERAIQRLDPRTPVRCVDAFQHLNPILSRIVDRTYMSVIRHAPGIWDYLYDNPDVVTRARTFEHVIHRYDSPKLGRLFDEFRPTVIACTQAFPCGVAADYKRRTGSTIPLYAILTDLLPHNFWLHDQVDGYFVGSEAAGQWFERAGALPAKIHHTGIPINPVFSDALDGMPRCRALGLDPAQPTVLLMGGGQGLGPMEQVVTALDSLHKPIQIVVITGVNTKLQRRLSARVGTFRRKVVVLGHVPFVHELMSFATLIVSKAGGLTTAEALAKQLPLIIVDPIPGQEVNNTNLLVAHNAAIRAQRLSEVPLLVSELLGRPDRLAALRRAAGQLGRPRAALEIAKILLQPR